MLGMCVCVRVCVGVCGGEVWVCVYGGYVFGDGGGGGGGGVGGWGGGGGGVRVCVCGGCGRDHKKIIYFLIT